VVVMVKMVGTVGLEDMVTQVEMQPELVQVLIMVVVGRLVHAMAVVVVALAQHTQEAEHVVVVVEQMVVVLGLILRLVTMAVMAAAVAQGRG